MFGRCEELEKFNQEEGRKKMAGPMLLDSIDATTRDYETRNPHADQVSSQEEILFAENK